MESDKDEKAVVELDENLLLQRLGEFFKKASEKGEKHIAVAEFHSLFQGVGFIIETDSNIIRPIPLGIEKFKQLDNSFQW